VVCFGCSVSIDGARVGRDVVALGGNVSITDGHVGRDAVAVGGSVALHGHAFVGRDASAAGGSLSVRDQSSVGRDAAAFGGTVSADPETHVGREISNVHGPAAGHFGNLSRWFGSIPGPGALPLWTFGSLVPAFGFVLLSVLLLVIFPRQVTATGLLAQRQPVASFGLGCLGVVVAIVLSVLFALTLVLLPVSFLLLVALGAAWALGWTAIFLVAGRRLLAAFRSEGTDPLPALLVGGVVLSLLWIVPLLNVFVGVFGGCVAVGAALGSRFGTRGPGDPIFGAPPGPPMVPPAARPPFSPGAPPPAGPPLAQPPA